MLQSVSKSRHFSPDKIWSVPLRPYRDVISRPIMSCTSLESSQSADYFDMQYVKCPILTILVPFFGMQKLCFFNISQPLKVVLRIVRKFCRSSREMACGIFFKSRNGMWNKFSGREKTCGLLWRPEKNCSFLQSAGCSTKRTIKRCNELPNKCMCVVNIQNTLVSKVFYQRLSFKMKCENNILVSINCIMVFCILYITRKICI